MRMSNFGGYGTHCVFRKGVGARNGMGGADTKIGPGEAEGETLLALMGAMH